MDLQNNDELLSTKPDLPDETIDVIISENIENCNILEEDNKKSENHDVQITNNINEASKQDKKVVHKEESEEENVTGGLQDVPLCEDLNNSDSSESSISSEMVNKSKVKHPTRNKEENNANGELDINTSSPNEIDTLWAEALKAQNEGNFKHAIQNFTAILENKHSNKEIKHKTKCRLVFALYQDNQADEAEKIGWESIIISSKEHETVANNDSTEDSTDVKNNENNTELSTVVSNTEETPKTENNDVIRQMSSLTLDNKKRKALNSTSDDDESTLTRLSECSDDSNNLIKLDLSQLVGDPSNNTEEGNDNLDEKDVKTDAIEEKDLSPVTSSHEELSEISRDVGHLNGESIIDNLTPIATSPTTKTEATAESLSEVSATKSMMSSTDVLLPTKVRKERKKKEKTKKEKGKSSAIIIRNPATDRIIERITGPTDLTCLHCNLKSYNKTDFQAHCRTEKHQHTVMSDEGRSWKYRPPPRGVGSEEYTLCAQIESGGTCRFGSQCVEAHSKEELKEWKERFEYRQKKIQRAAKMYGKSFVDTLLDKLGASNKPERMLLAKLDGVECVVSGEKQIELHCKGSEYFWNFKLSTKTNMILRNIGLINDVTRQQFSLVAIKHTGHICNHKDTTGVTDSRWTDSRPEPIPDVKRFYSLDALPTQHQEWSHPDTGLFESAKEMTYEIKVAFKTDIYGTFRQSVVFNFGNDTYLRQDLCVEMIPPESEDDEKLKELQESIIQQAERWDSTNSKIVDFEPPISKPPAQDELILKKYPAPKPTKFRPTQNVVDTQLTKQNYRGRMHELLYIEEMAQFEHVSQFNVVTKLQLASRYLLMPTSTNSSTAKYARPGEMFGKMKLGNNLSEDTSAGRLILTNCPTLLLSVSNWEIKLKSDKESRKENCEKDDKEEDTTKAEEQEDEKSEKDSKRRTAYVVGIEDTGKSTLYLRLPSSLVTTYDLEEDQEFEVDVQFQLNRLPLCEMHHAVDKLPDLSLVYPDIREKIVIPWSPGKQWGDDLNAKLNPKQREAVVAITTPLVISLPPILIIGPYGTGKTFTLGQAIKMLLQQETHRRVLVCTHSNSAADLYIREYLHPFIEKDGNSHIKLLRIYYENRWVQTVNPIVQKYCLITTSDSITDYSITGTRSFRYPTLDDVKDCDVVVATLSTSRCLSAIGLPQGHFTHILLDEAAQAMECEASMPLALSSLNTRVVLAGDHMQLSPEVFSQFALDKRFNKSLLERLYDLYPPNFACKILLCENYRSHAAIISYTSELFYEQKLIASGKQASHESWYPLTMFTARGEDIQDANSTSFYNNSEVYEVVERVAELQRTWSTKDWGQRDENAIGIVTPYYDQVQRIRSELRKRRLFGVSVERVLNVQGKQFRAIFLSTVRTRKTCISSQEDMVGGDLDFGFLSNAKLLNTAITRAQSLVAVVGDPIALCSMGKCRKLWERFMQICHENKSLMGLTWTALRAMLDNVEMKKAYVLNPLAPEFVPRSKRYNESFLKIFNETMKQFMTAAAASSNTCTTVSQFPNVLGGTGLVPPPPIPPFGYPQALIPSVAGFMPPPPPHHRPPPPLHPHVGSANAHRLPSAPIPSPFNPYMTVPPLHPPLPPPWGMKFPPVPDLAFPPAQLMPNIPIPPPSMPVVMASSAVTTNASPSQQISVAKGDSFGMGLFNNLPMKPRPGSMMGNPLAASNPNLAQLNTLQPNIAPSSPRAPSGQFPHFTRNISPLPVHMAHSSKHIQHQHSPRQANPQFANSKYQRGSANSNSPVMSDSTPNMSLTNEAQDNDSKTIIPELDPSFIYLQGGVHFPKAKQVSNLQNKFTDSTKSSSSQSDLHQQYKIQQPQIGQINTQMVEQQNKENHPLYMKDEKLPTMFDMALDILPQDFDLTSLLQSPQIQKAWFNQLTISRSPKDAARFQDLISNLKKSPELVLVLKEQMDSSKLFKTSNNSSIKEDINLPQFNPSIKRQPHNEHNSSKEKPAILAEDLEAILLKESDNAKLSQAPNIPTSVHTTQQSNFFSNYPNPDPRLQTIQNQMPMKQKPINEGDFFLPVSSSGDAFFSMVRGNNSSLESSIQSESNLTPKLPFKSDKRLEPSIGRGSTENSIDDIYNDPILSEILRNSSNSSPDSGVFNSDSVTSLLGQKSTRATAHHLASYNNYGAQGQTSDQRNSTNYEKLLEENRAKSFLTQTSSLNNDEGSGGYVPLYMRRAGGTSNVNPNSESNSKDTLDVKMAHTDGKYLSLTTPRQNNGQKIGNSRFTVIPNPTTLPMRGFTGFDREPPPINNFAQPPPPLSAPPDVMPRMFPDISRSISVENHQPKTSNDANKPLTYANVLRAPQKTAKEREMEAAMADPIIRMRSLGTQANQDDQGMSGGALGGFGLGSGARHPHESNNETFSRQEEQNASWFNTFNQRW